jgi:8-hydroxy-5-deazaflavin:NADPH oxidoreductase
MPDARSIAVVGGTGREGMGIALRFARAGVRVLVGSRSLEKARDAVAAARSRWGDLPLEPAENALAIAGADTVFLAVPFDQVAAIVDAQGHRFAAGALAVDITVPLSFVKGKPELTLTDVSAAEKIRSFLPPPVALACAFKTIPAHTLADLDEPLDCDDLICGDSAESRSRIADLVRLIPGLRPIDAGPLDAARTLERMTFLAIGINRRYKVHAARFRVVGV